uniref:Uncharacterized protein n=1 Tax=Anguilla anguilla TaxID=7936 RepID=A0A0E9X1G5_ANGAN
MCGLDWPGLAVKLRYREKPCRVTTRESSKDPPSELSLTTSPRKPSSQVTTGNPLGHSYNRETPPFNAFV